MISQQQSRAFQGLSMHNHGGQGGMRAQAEVACPNEGCNAIYPRSSSKAHLSVCPFARLQCPYAELGCAETYLRREQDLHHAQNVQFHAALTVRKLTEMDKNVKGIKREFTKIKTQLTKTGEIPAQTQKQSTQQAQKQQKNPTKRRRTTTNTTKSRRGRAARTYDADGMLVSAGMDDNGDSKSAAEKFSSSYHGVYWNKTAKRWVSQIVNQGKQEYLGLYKSEVEAARAYDERAKQLEGKKLNFVE